MKTNNNFRIALIAIAILIVAGIASALVMGLALDTSAGAASIVTVDFGKNFELNDVQKALSDKGVKGAQIVKSTASDAAGAFKAVVRTKAAAGPSAEEALKAAFPDATVSSAQSIEASYSPALWGSGALWLGIGLVAAALYVYVRFGWQSAVSALAIAVIDLALAIAVSMLVRVEFGVGILAAAAFVTIYSLVNSTLLLDGYRALRKAAKNAPEQDPLSAARFRCVFFGLAAGAMLLLIAFMGGSTLQGFAIPALFGVAASTCTCLFVTPQLYLGLAK